MEEREKELKTLVESGQSKIFLNHNICNIFK